MTVAREHTPEEGFRSTTRQALRLQRGDAIKLGLEFNGIQAGERNLEKSPAAPFNDFQRGAERGVDLGFIALNIRRVLQPPMLCLCF